MLPVIVLRVAREVIRDVVVVQCLQSTTIPRVSTADPSFTDRIREAPSADPVTGYV